MTGDDARRTGISRPTVININREQGMRLGKKLAPWVEMETVPDDMAQYVADNPEEFSAEYAETAREELAARRYERAQRVRPPAARRVLLFSALSSRVQKSSS